MSRPKVILTCKQVSKTLLEDHYDALPWHKKLAVKFHISWCWICGRVNKQIIEMQHGIDLFREKEDKDPVPPCLCLPDDSKDHILKAIREHQDR